MLVAPREVLVCCVLPWSFPARVSCPMLRFGIITSRSMDRHAKPQCYLLLAEKRNFVSSQDLIFWNLAETMGSLFQRRPLASAAEDGRKHPTAGCALKRR